MGFHMVPLLKRMVWLKILYIQKFDELLLETVEWSDWWKIYFYKKILYKIFFSSLNAVISTNESTEFITGHVGGNLEEEWHYFAAKMGGRAGPIWSCPKKPPHPSFQEWYHVKAHKKLENLM